jgi:hypothetical protein
VEERLHHRFDSANSILDADVVVFVLAGLALLR